MNGEVGSRLPGVRLVIIDDSPYYRLRFAKLFGRSRDISVVSVAANGEEGIQAIARDNPHVVVLDLTMPRMDGFTVLRWAQSNAQVPIVVCSSRSDRESIFKALELGAVDYITKPSSVRNGFEGIESLLIERVKAAARARVHVGESEVSKVGEMPVDSRRPRARVIAIAASTGGPTAIQRMVSQFSPDLTVPIIVAQHMPPGFTRLFAERLDRQSHYIVVEARDRMLLEPGRIYIAPGGLQTRVEGQRDLPVLSVGSRSAGDVYAPSADQLFASMAHVFQGASVAAVLTGMGDDGSRGATAVKEHGGYVLAESSDSALIFGMPRATIATGCVDAQIPLESIPETLRALANGAREDRSDGEEK